MGFIEQIVYHGPGYDTLGYSLANNETSYYQIDKQEILDFKNQVIDNKFISVYSSPLSNDWCLKLELKGFDSNFSLDKSYF